MENNTSAKYKGAISKAIYYSPKGKNLVKAKKLSYIYFSEACFKSIQDYIGIGSIHLQQFSIIFKNIILLYVVGTYYSFVHKTPGFETQISYVI